MDRAEKNKKIKASMKATLTRHASMDCRVFEIKILRNRLSKTKKQHLDAYFREAKWFYNAILDHPFDKDLEKPKTVSVLVKDHFETRAFTVLGPQVRQAIVSRTRSNIKALSKKKEKGEMVGALKYKPYVNSIPLKQYGSTHRIDFERDEITLQNMSKEPLKVRGLNQLRSLSDGYEIANATLQRRPSGIYLLVTVFVPKMEPVYTGKAVGIDFGIKNMLTLSDGTRFNVDMPETKGVKLASRRKTRAFVKNKRKHSKRDEKRRQRLQKAYEKQTNRKKDAAHKIVHAITSKNDVIAIQDEMIASWHKGLFGKQVQHSIMGLVKSELKNNSKTIVVSKSFPSTQQCPICGKKTYHPLSKRDFDCSYCGYHHFDRDRKAALMILQEAAIQSSYPLDTASLWSIERFEESRGGQDLCLKRQDGASNKPSPMKREAQGFSLG